MATTAGLSSALSSALTGINASKQVLSTLSNNIANANTDGYTRKIVTVSNNIVAGEGHGVKVDNITRQVDLYLQRAMQQETGMVGNASVLSDYATRIQALLGQPNGSSSATTDNSIASAITGFFTALQQLASAPSDASLQVNALQSGQNVATKISGLAAGLQDLRYEADQQIFQDVGTVNSILKQLQDTNAGLAYVANNGGGNAPDLLDQRDQQLNQLSKYVDVTYYFDSTKQVHINTAGGAPLLDNALYQVNFTPQPSGKSIAAGQPMSPITVNRLNEVGVAIPPAIPIVTGGPSSAVTTTMKNGEIAGLLTMRDQQISQMVDQLDNLASAMMTQANAIHNSGTPFPGNVSLTGQREVSATQITGWGGNMKLALLTRSGQPVPSPYPDDTNGLPPLNIDFSKLDSGSGQGYPSTQSIIDAINNYYAPKNQVSLGDLHNIQLVSNSAKVPTSSRSFDFDFNLENLSGNSSKFFVTNISVRDDANNAVAPVTSTLPSISLASTGTYTTSANSNIVTVSTAAATTLQDGDYIYLSTPSGSVDGIAASQLSGFFKVSNVTATGFDIQSQGYATSGGSFNEASMTGTPSYATANAGENIRTKANGVVSVDLSSNPTSTYYMISVDVATQNADGSLSSSTIQYMVNQSLHTLNTPYGAATASGNAVLKAPASYAPIVTAQLVDIDGNPLPQTNGAYSQVASGYLQIKSNNSNYVLAIDSLNSQQIGFPNQTPSVAGTNRSFSSYFGLNNFFNENLPNATGDTVAGSAMAMSVQTRLLNNPNLLSTGQITQSLPQAGVPRYTYERSPGDNSVVTQLSMLGTVGMSFAATGGLGDATTSLNGYAGQILSYASAQASNAHSQSTNLQAVMKGMKDQVSSTSGVNLDEELANTIIYQNSYAASARIITVTNDLFGKLIDSIS